MKGKIGLEEHFAIPETLADSRGFFPDAVWTEVKERLLDLHGRRLKLMDEHGLEMMLLSINAPVVQAAPDLKQANELSRKGNDYLAEQVAKRPDRFQGLAALPMQDPDLAIKELHRSIKELGFKGVLVNGFSQVGDKDTTVYYDLKQYWPFWAEVEKLDVPFYLHPRNPLPRDSRIYEGHPWLMGPTWAFGQETAVHALRLMGSGLFDAYPKLAIVLGHMGEGLPYSMWRVDNRNAWAGRCTIGTNVPCQPNAAAAATCTAAGGGVMCPECAAGSCNVDPSGGGSVTTVWDFINQLNAAGFAGHSDWRLPTSAGAGLFPTGQPAELESIVDETQGACGSGGPLDPCIDPVFGPTAFAGYWTGSPLEPLTSAFEQVWGVFFAPDGGVFSVTTNQAHRVRAVRTSE